MKNLFLEGVLMCAMIFSMTSCGDDDKKDEIVDDPLQTQTEYYIVGKVMDAEGAVSGSSVEVSSDNSTTTDANGAYTLTVKEAGSYTVKFTASGLETLEAPVTIASGAANRTQVTLNVRLAQAIDMEKGSSAQVTDNGTVLNVPNQETNETGAIISIPGGAADAETIVAAVVYEEAQAEQAEVTTTAEQTITASFRNVAVETTPAEATALEDIEISIPNAVADASSHFDTNFMSAMKDDDATTRAAVDFGSVTFKNNSYVITIPQGEKIAGKYSAEIQYSRKAESVKAGDYNKVNGQNSVARIENRDYSALNVTLNVETTCGWEYTTSPAAALSAVGASTELASIIQQYIENNEGQEGTYTISKTLNASISGNHVLFFGSKAKTQEKSYTFHVIANGQESQVVVKLLCYVGYTEEYTNGSISQHSGGTTGTN